MNCKTNKLDIGWSISCNGSDPDGLEEMNENNQIILYKKFPLSYRHVYDTYYTNIDCGDGWFPIIYNFSIKMEKLIEKWISDNIEIHSKHPRIAEIKEKFGLLRIYIDDATEEMLDLVALTEKQSAKICEMCGLQGKVRYRGYISTLCNECNDLLYISESEEE